MSMRAYAPVRLLATPFFLAAGVCAALAQLPVARVTSLFPPGGQVGTQVEVTVSGSDLDDPARLRFSHPGITGAPKGEGNRFTVVIASSVPPGTYDARFVGRFGISNPRAFVVGARPEVTAPATNTSAADAIELAPQRPVNSRATQNGVAWFKFAAKKGQRLFVECLGEAIDSRMEPTLVLSRSDGRESERARTGGFLDFTAPADGAYLLRVSDFLYRGGDDYFYRLTLSTGPRVDFVFPSAGLPGTTATFTFYGRNLPEAKPADGLAIDGKPLERVTTDIATPSVDAAGLPLNTTLRLPPAGAGLDGFDYRFRGEANPLLLTLATAPVVLEQEPNNAPAHAQKISPPCEVAGQFFPAGEADCFVFDAQKDEVWWIEVFSHRLGLPTDPFMVLERITRNDQGEETVSDARELYDQDANAGDREFNTTTRDPVMRLAVKEPATYRIQVRDLFNRHRSDPRHVYRLSVRRETPDFRLVALTVAPRLKADAKDIPVGVPFLRLGETVPIRVMALRRDGFQGEIELSVEDAPPGLQALGRIEAEKSAGTLFLTAHGEAKGWSGALRVAGRARIVNSEVTRPARAATLVHHVNDFDNARPDARLAREFTVGVSESETTPVVVAAVATNRWEATAGGSLTIPLAVTRHADYAAAFKLKAIGAAALDALKEIDVGGKATNAALELDLTKLKLAPGTYTFALHGTTTGKYRNNPEAAVLAEATAKEADKAAADLAAAAKQAAEDLDKAVKAAEEAQAAAKSAEEQLTAAEAALEKSPGEAALVAEREAAKNAAAEATKRASAAADTQAAAEKAKTVAETRAKEAQQKKEETAKRAKELAERAKPRDVTVPVCSAPITLTVKPAEQAKKQE